MTPPGKRDGSSRVFAGPEDLTAFTFDNVHDSVHAAHELKRLGFDVQVAPRPDPGCGVAVLVERGTAAAAAAALAAAGVRPQRASDYEPRGGADAAGSRRAAACG